MEMNLYGDSLNIAGEGETPCLLLTVRKELEKKTQKVIDVAERDTDTLGIAALRKAASYPVLILLYFYTHNLNSQKIYKKTNESL